jgi:hypothetical protein
MRWVAAGLLIAGPLAAQQPSPPAPPPIRINAEIQLRWIMSHQDTAPGLLDQTEGGFQVRRARVAFSGSVLSPRLSYRIRPAYDRATGNVQLDEAWVSWDFPGDWSLRAGQFKPQFLREEFVSSFAQLAAERSYATDYFSVDYSQGAELSRTTGRGRMALSLHDGSYAANSDFSADRTDVAVSARVEVMAFGDLEQLQDFSGRRGGRPGLLLGAGVDWERGETDSTRAIPQVFKYTLDASLELNGLSFAAAFFAQRFSVDSLIALPTNLRAARQTGFVLQAGAFVSEVLELFGRSEQTDFDGAYYRNSGDGVQGGSRNLGFSRMTGYAAGLNWYVRQQALKLTADVQVLPDPVPVANTGAGLVRSDGARQVVLRTQAQLRF